MLVSVDNQAYIFLCVVLGGMFIGFVYDLFRVSRKVIKTKNIIVHFQDILFWLLVSILIFAILFVCNGGEIRGYSLLAILLGVIIYEMLFSHYIIKVLLKLIEVIIRFFRLVYKLISIPLIFIFKLISIPVGFLINKLIMLKRLIRKICNALKHKINLNIKNLKNTIKKY